MATVSRYTTAAGETRWRVRYRTPDRRQTDKRGFKRRKDADDFLASLTVQINRGEYVAPADGRRTVRELADPWLERQAHIKPSYRASLRGALDHHVLPRWGDVQLRAIRTTDVQAWVARMATGTPGDDGERGLSASVVKRNHGVLRGILEDAVTDRMLASNPAARVKLPRSQSKPRNYLTPSQVRALADEAGNEDPAGRGRVADDATVRVARGRRAFVLLLAYTGLRWGEATALRVSDVDFLRRRLRIERAIVWLHGEPIEGTPKTHETRTVPVPQFLVDVLSVECKGKPRDARVFTTADGGPMPHPSSDSGWFASAVKRAGVPRVTPHDLRHTAASLAISAGANVKAVQRMLGHATASQTLDRYADLFDSDLEDVAVRLGELYAAQHAG